MDPRPKQDLVLRTSPRMPAFLPFLNLLGLGGTERAFKVKFEGPRGPKKGTSARTSRRNKRLSAKQARKRNR